MCGQQVCVNPLKPQRPALNVVRYVGEWTWFSMAGTLYRKHDTISIAEIWYTRKQTSSLRDYEGMLLDTTRVAHRLELTSKNCSMPAGYTAMRLDNFGTVWFSDYHGTDASFDGTEWILHTKFVPKGDEEPPMQFEWGEHTPFHGDRFWPRSELNVPPPVYLLESIPGGPPKRKNGDRPPSAVLNFDVFPNGNLIILTHEGAQIFRPLEAHHEVAKPAPDFALAPYPNPASSSVTLTLNRDVAAKMTVDVRDITGRLRMQGIEGLSSGTVVDVMGLEEGVYVALLKSMGTTSTTTFTVRR